MPDTYSENTGNQGAENNSRRVTQAWMDNWIGALQQDTQAGIKPVAASSHSQAFAVEHGLMLELIGLVHDIQKCAFRKYAGEHVLTLQDYAVGEKFHRNRAVLEHTVSDILAKLETDTLPGVNAGTVEKLRKTLADYRATKSADGRTPAKKAHER